MGEGEKGERSNRRKTKDVQRIRSCAFSHFRLDRLLIVVAVPLIAGCRHYHVALFWIALRGCSLLQHVADLVVGNEAGFARERPPRSGLADGDADVGLRVS